MSRQEQLYLWLALRQVPKLGPVSIRKRFSQTGSIEQLWLEIEATPEDKAEWQQLGQQEYTSLIADDVQLLTIDDPSFPRSLKILNDIDPVLYVRGRIDYLSQPAVAVVGSRKASPYGRDITQQLVNQLVTQGLTIISGMALGVDTIAHQTALEAGGQTVAVWGTGLDIIYPPTNKSLAAELSQKGTIVSQFPLGSKSSNFSFPARNRLIAGLAQVVVVTEAALDSGSLITAQAARDYGRPVFGLPGSIFSPGSAGPHQLIQQGARLVVDAADIVDSIGVADALPASLVSEIPSEKGISPAPGSSQEITVLDLLSSGPQAVDDIIRSSHLTSSQVLATISLLELKGQIKSAGNGHYRKA